MLKKCKEIANPLTVIHDHNYYHNVKESGRKLQLVHTLDHFFVSTHEVLQVTRAVPSQVLLSWGSLPDVTSQGQEKEAAHGLVSREHKAVPVDYNSKSAEVWSRPPPQLAATNHELWMPATITNSFSRAAKSSALYKIGVSIRNQQRSSRKRKLFASSASQGSAALLTATNSSQQSNSEDSHSIASDEGSSSCSSSSQTSSEVGARPLKEFSLKVPKLELNK